MTNENSMSEETLADTPQLETEALPLPAPNAPEPLSMGAVLRIAPMRRLWYAQIVSVFGDFLALFAVITVLTFKFHATAQQVTGIQIAYLLPIALLGIVSGVFVDRWPVKITLVASDYTRACLCLLLLLVHNVYEFYAVLAAISVFSSFFSPAQGIAIRSAVPMHGLRAANSLVQQVMFILRIVGGPIAVLIVRYFGEKVCYIADSVSFVASGTLIASLTLVLPQRSAVVQAVEGKSAVVITSEKIEKTGLARILADMKEGASFIFHHAALLFVILALAAGMFVMGCFGPLIAIFVRDTLLASTTVFATASASIGVGLFTGVTILNAAAKKVKNTTLVYGGLAGIALGTLLLAAAPHIAFNVGHLRIAVDVIMTVAGCFTIGFACGGIIIPSQTMIQQETPQAMLGRVGSTVMSLIFSAQIAGLILSGILANHTSVRRVFAICAAMLVVLIIVGKLWMEPEEHTPATV
jgi:DHA3 family macrolide efflux protein-like MFS transporter